MQRRYINQQGKTSRKKKSNTRQSAILSKLLVILGLSIVLAIVVLVFYYPSEATNDQPKKIIKESTIGLQTWVRDLEDLMRKKYFDPEWVNGLDRIRNHLSPQPGRFLLTMNYPPKYQVHEFVFQVIQLSKRNEFEVMETYEKFNPKQMSVGLTTSKGGLIQLNFRENRELEWYTGKIAIIIDDFGYRLDTFIDSFFEIPYPITIAIIPGTDYAKQIAEKAQLAGLDILIHLPMEPLEGEVENKGYTIFTGMSQREIDAVIERAIENVPGAIGVNNHMGSKATANRTTMQRLMRSLKKQNFIFVDSITNRNSVAYQQAMQNEVPALELSTFIDNPEKNVNMAIIMRSIVSQLSQENPEVLIGHAREQTSVELPIEMSRWAAKGVSFVSASDLVENQ